MNDLTESNIVAEAFSLLVTSTSVVCAVYDKLVKYITTVFYYVGDPDL